MLKPKIIQVRHVIAMAVIITGVDPAGAQRYIPADPLDLMFHEKAYFQGEEDDGPLILRPVFQSPRKGQSNLSISLRSELFDNTGAPNLENTAQRWIGKGESFFSSVNISYSGTYLAFSLEPFYFSNENLDYPEPIRVGLYSKLNDNRPFKESPYEISGLREAQVYLHYNGIGFGISNANLWWGPGIHSTLHMTNNTRGFEHLFIGTLREQRIGKLGLDIRYFFSEFDSLSNTGEPYFTALALTTTLHSDPVVTVGLSRVHLSGGNIPTPETITRKEAMLLAVEPLFLSEKQSEAGNPESSLDFWDQTLSGYLTATFPNSGLKLFLELGRNDHAWDGADFRRQPDHSAASVVGLRKYGLFGNDNLTLGLEYARIMQSVYGIGGFFGRKRVGGNWYERVAYEYSSYDGRHWAAHSGPDSDDLTVYLGYLGERFSIVPGFNYERHGIISNDALVWKERYVFIQDPDTREPVKVRRRVLVQERVNIFGEVKFEFRLDMRYRIHGLRFNLYYEKEFVDNYEFKANRREGEVVWFGVEKVFDRVKLPRFLSWFK